MRGAEERGEECEGKRGEKEKKRDKYQFMKSTLIQNQSSHKLYVTHQQLIINVS